MWILSVWTGRPGTWTRLSTLSSVRVGSSALVRFFFFFLNNFLINSSCKGSASGCWSNFTVFLCSFSNSCHPHGLFPAKKASKFRDWLDCSTLELKPNSMAMEILSYLAYETVAQACEVNVLDICHRQPRRRRASLYILSGFPFPDYGSVSAGEAGNDREDQPNQSRDLCQLHPLQHALRGATLTAEEACLWNSPGNCFWKFS